MEDLAQMAFLEIFRSLGNYRGEATLATWVDRCTARVAFAHLGRKRPKVVPIDAAFDVHAGGPSVEQRALDREITRRVYAALDRIDPLPRMAFALYAIDGRSMEEVATIMDATVAATKSRVWRARQEFEQRARRDPLLADFLEIERVDPDTRGVP